MYTTILKVTLPSAFRSIATGVVLGIARAAGETAPLIFTALFSYYYITGFGDLFYEMGSLAVLIYNFALEPYDAQNKISLGSFLYSCFVDTISKYIFKDFGRFY